MTKNNYSEHTINELIEMLKAYRDELGGDTKVYLTDFEYHGKQTMFELSEVAGEDELFIFYEANEGLW